MKFVWYKANRVYTFLSPNLVYICVSDNGNPVQIRRVRGNPPGRRGRGEVNGFATVLQRFFQWFCDGSNNGSVNGLSNKEKSEIRDNLKIF